MLKLKLFMLLFFATTWTYATSEWPKEIPAGKEGVITIYQPTLEKFENRNLTGRSAVSYRKSPKEEPVFGVIWFTAVLETDKDSRMAVMESFKITKTKFSTDADSSKLTAFENIVETEVMKWELDISIDEILTSLEDKKNLNDPYLKNDPPEIIYRDMPATLVLLDGEPIIKTDETIKMERVMNTSFLIVKTDGKFYTYASGLWYESPDPKSGHKYVKSIPKVLEPIHQQIQEQEKNNNDGKTIERPSTPPEVIVRTTPAELLQTDGEPKYVAIEGTTMLYVSNTLDEIFKDVESQRTFTLLSGRWFSATSLKGPWTYIPADQLPADFLKIPRGSEKDGVLASVGGTPEAEEAKIDAQIPQTAKVERATAKVDVKYDGTPKFSSIQNTSLLLSENSNVTVLKTADGKYYAVDNGIWFVSNEPTGPFVVSDVRPADVDKIPPDNSAYNTKYVYIYDTSPQYVYVGYTPGYFGTYVYGPTIVYGTGYYYQPWYGVYYYPRPVTYGFGMSYNPWTGWSMSYGMSYNTGWYAYGGVHMSIHFGGYWGGCGYYRPPYHHWGYNGGYYGHRNNVQINNPTINVNRPVNINTGDINVNRNHTNNVYKKVDGAKTRDISRSPDRGNATTRPATRPSTRPTTIPAASRQSTGATTLPSAPVGTRPENNVYPGRDGNVYRNDNNGNLQQRDNNNWKPANNAATTRPSYNNYQNSQNRSNMRNQNFNKQRPAAPASRPAARPAGGGRRR